MKKIAASQELIPAVVLKIAIDMRDEYTQSFSKRMPRSNNKMPIAKDIKTPPNNKVILIIPQNEIM